MNETQELLGKESSNPETADILRRILAAVEHDRRKRWVEILCAVVLSLATVASAWCAYQANLWSGVQTFRLAAANLAARESSESTISAHQARSFDATMFIHYIEARATQNEKLAEFLHRRFRPEMKTAVDAWLKTDPMNNPDAPLSPFAMPAYVQKEQQEAKRQHELSVAMHDAALEANNASDRYVLLTVLFASVLFFAGIAGTLDIRRLRIILGIIALTLFLATIVALSTMPICRE
jgi:hypothetical protein